MDKVQCALCGASLKSLEINLKTINSKHSHTPLLLLLESAVGPYLSFHFNICLLCYELINELDAIELRQREIHDRLKRYILTNEEINSKEKVTDVDTAAVENTVVHDVNDINAFSCHNIDKNHVNNEFPSVLEIKSDNDYFLSKTYNVKTGECKNENEPLQVNPDANKKRRGRKKKYPDIPKPHKCHCSKEFRTMRELKNHMNSHSNHRPFICDICGMSYKHKPAFDRHMDMHNGINPFTCVYCNKSFTQKGALVRHVPIHTGEKPYQCDECGKRFIHHTSFNMHRLSHTGQKPYKCTICGLALISGSHLKRHTRIHTGEKKYSCETCGRRFAERYNLSTHEKLHYNSKSILSVNPRIGAQTGKGKKIKSLSEPSEDKS